MATIEMQKTYSNYLQKRAKLDKYVRIYNATRSPFILKKIEKWGGKTKIVVDILNKMEEESKPKPKPKPNFYNRFIKRTSDNNNK
jgi:hypothetical protein